MDIYIKSFNRPYLLHRTLASIYEYMVGFNGKVVVLDDGTPDKYLKKIKTLFPEIEIRKSPYYHEKNRAIEDKQSIEKRIPAAFWREEVLKGSEYFILLEDDMWFEKHWDYTLFKSEIEREQMDMVKFMWLKNELLISQNVKRKFRYFGIIDPVLLTRSPLIFHAVFVRNRFRLREILSKFGMVDFDKEILKYYHIFIVAGGAFSKKYYENVWSHTQNKVDEFLQISQVLKHIKRYRFGHTNDELIKATYKFTASSIDKERFGNELDVLEFNRILNEAWLHNKTYDINDFANDIPDNWIKSCCIGENVKFEVWQDWYAKFKKSYENIGCRID